MSLEISLRKKGDEEEAMSLNWLRNPFGLERWAEANVGKTDNSPENERLWHVLNNWNYGKSKEIDKCLFKEVVDGYWCIIRELEVGYFAFTLPMYRQFVEGKLRKRLEFSDWCYRRGHTEIAIKMEFFEDVATLDGYKEWFHRLVLFAEKLQEQGMEFYCSN